MVVPIGRRGKAFIKDEAKSLLRSKYSTSNVDFDDSDIHRALINSLTDKFFLLHEPDQLALFVDEIIKEEKEKQVGSKVTDTELRDTMLLGFTETNKALQSLATTSSKRIENLTASVQTLASVSQNHEDRLIGAEQIIGSHGNRIDTCEKRIAKLLVSFILHLVLFALLLLLTFIRSLLKATKWRIRYRILSNRLLSHRDVLSRWIVQ